MIVEQYKYYYRVSVDVLIIDNGTLTLFLLFENSVNLLGTPDMHAHNVS